MSLRESTRAGLHAPERSSFIEVQKRPTLLVRAGLSCPYKALQAVFRWCYGPGWRRRWISTPSRRTPRLLAVPTRDQTVARSIAGCQSLNAQVVEAGPCDRHHDLFPRLPSVRWRRGYLNAARGEDM